VRLAHLSLAVADQERSRRFYETFFEFDCTGEPDPEGCLHLTDGDDFDLTLVGRPEVSPPASLHFGIRVADPESVRRVRSMLAAADVETGDLFEGERRVAFHCSDPDGYRLEVFADRNDRA
jgi:catechol 2,3-dioxygenase-like lactoylglutathione lyase family enzyme